MHTSAAALLALIPLLAAAAPYDPVDPHHAPIPPNPPGYARSCLPKNYIIWAKPEQDPGWGQEDKFLLDVSEGGSIGLMQTVSYEQNAKGAAYYYRCGEKETKEKFDPMACSAMENSGGCTDVTFPLVSPAEIHGCAMKSKTHAISYTTKGGKLGVANVYSDACGWLGGRCGKFWPDARALIIRGAADLRTTKTKRVDLTEDSLGSVAIRQDRSVP